MEINSEHDFDIFLKEFHDEISIGFDAVKNNDVIAALGAAFHRQCAKAVNGMPRYGEVDKDSFPSKSKLAGSTPPSSTSTTGGYHGAAEGTEHTWKDGERYKKTGGKWVHVSTGNANHNNHAAIESHYEKMHGIHHWGSGTYQRKSPGVEVRLSGKHEPYENHQDALNHIDRVYNEAREVALKYPAGHSAHMKNYENLTHLFGRLGIHAHDNPELRGALEHMSQHLMNIRSRGQKSGHYSYDIYHTTSPGSTTGAELRNSVRNSSLNPLVAAQRRAEPQHITA